MEYKVEMPQETGGDLATMRCLTICCTAQCRIGFSSDETVRRIRDYAKEDGHLRAVAETSQSITLYQTKWNSFGHDYFILELHFTQKTELGQRLLYVNAYPMKRVRWVLLLLNLAFWVFYLIMLLTGASFLKMYPFLLAWLLYNGFLLCAQPLKVHRLLHDLRTEGLASNSTKWSHFRWRFQLI